MFVIRSYVRTRISKVRPLVLLNASNSNTHAIQIEKYARYISMTPEVHEKLSQLELDHAQRCDCYTLLSRSRLMCTPCSHVRDLDALLTRSVLRNLPGPQQGLDDLSADIPPMSQLFPASPARLDLHRLSVRPPDKQRPVFAHARTNCPSVRLPEYVYN